MTIESRADLAGVRRAGAVAAEARRAMERAVRPGVTTAELDAVGAAVYARHGATSAPQRDYGFPGVNCISVNDEIVHGVPGDRPLAPGDVVKLDVTVVLDGYVADTAVTVLVPPVSAEAERLRTAARRGFTQALAAVRPGLRLATLGARVEREVVRRGCAVIRELTGHGVGRRIHEAPAVPNFGDLRARGVLTLGLVFALEPLVSLFPARVVEDADGWTLRTHNGALAAHHEHTVIVAPEGAEVVTA